MKVILVNGSPHQHGCTFTALDEARKTLEEEGIGTEMFWVGTKPLGRLPWLPQVREAEALRFR